MLNVIRILQFLLICLFSVSILNAQESIIPDKATKDSLIAYLDDICQWIVESDVGSGELKINAKRRTSIFINSNLSRVLVAGYEITGKQIYLKEAFEWFDLFVELQQNVEASNGSPAGFWGDFSPTGNIYLGDTGTAATALAGIVRFADDNRRTRYITALQKYANFVMYGSKEDPQGKGRPAAKSFINNTGDDIGSVGCGYYRDELSTAPYIISTSVTGVAFFSCLYEITGNLKLLDIAKAATNWILKQRDPFGEMPYMLHNFTLDVWPLDTMSYVADGIVSVYNRTNDEKFRQNIVTSINRSIQWILNGQNRHGTWGTLRSEDQQRSQGILNLLVWYYDTVTPHPKVLKSIRANYEYFLNRDNSEKYGVMHLPITTGFVGLGIAEVLQPGITYKVK